MNDCKRVSFASKEHPGYREACSTHNGADWIAGTTHCFVAAREANS